MVILQTGNWTQMGFTKNGVPKYMDKTTGVLVTCKSEDDYKLHNIPNELRIDLSMVDEIILTDLEAKLEQKCEEIPGYIWDKSDWGKYERALRRMIQRGLHWTVSQCVRTHSLYKLPV